MPQQAPIYDLVLLLSMGAPDDRRAKLLSDVEAAIANGGGSIERNDDWGTRRLSYEISHQADAEYHLLQFSAPPSLLDDLSHTLRITDDVLRFRIIKVIPGTPPAPDTAPPVVAPTPAGVAGTSSPTDEYPR
jgi:small subunit ribosomal protein S6